MGKAHSSSKSIPILMAELLMVVAGVLGAQPCAADSGRFGETGSLINGRAGHTSTLLENGTVLVAGGSASLQQLSTAELYDPTTASWSATGNLLNSRVGHTATLLQTGMVLIAGAQDNPPASATAELYNPANGKWSATGALNQGRYSHTETLLPNGTVLVAGGLSLLGYLATAELYNPETGKWSLTGSLNVERASHTATLLQNGMVLVVGGFGDNGSVASAEIFNPSSGEWSATGELATPRYSHTATLLADGRVLVAGGYLIQFFPVDIQAFLSSAELYDPAAGTWAPAADMVTARIGHTATLLRNATVLVAGGYNDSRGCCAAIGLTELYDPATAIWSSTGSLVSPRFGHTETLLESGLPLIAGGSDPNNKPLASAELYGEPTLSNISTRLSVGTDDNVLIGGFIIAGTGVKAVILRAVGPSLPFSEALSDPVLELYGSSGYLVTSNDNWQDYPEKQKIIDSQLAPADDKESAIFVYLDPGAYTAIVRGAGGTTGVGLIEIYDLDETISSKLANISTRGFVQGGDDVMIGGTIILGQVPTTTLFRAIGPSLPLSGKLGDPMLELHDDNGALISSNDNWRDSQEAEIAATMIPPTDDAESAILATLQPGAYTAIVRGKDNGAGIGLVEAYQF